LNTHTNLLKSPLVIGTTWMLPEEIRSALFLAGQKKDIELRILEMSGSEDLAKVDAFLSPGGHDIDPKYFTEELNEQLALELMDLHRKFGNKGKVESHFESRDKLEFSIMEAYFKSDLKTLPFLGICYGMQVLAVASGLPLIVDLQAQLGIPARQGVEDQIHFLRLSVASDSESESESELDSASASELEKIMGVSSFLGPKRHHQVADIAFAQQYHRKTLQILAVSNDGQIPEIIVRSDRPSMGIQYHAESSADLSVRLAPFLWLLEKARDHRLQNQSS